MDDLYKLLRSKTATVELTGDGIRFIVSDENIIAFIADNKRTFRIKKNVGNLGALTTYSYDGSLITRQSNPNEFINGKQYFVYNIEYYPQKRCRRVESPPDICHEVFVELQTNENKYCDLLIRADKFSVYINDELQVIKARRVFAGYYKRYDGFPFYVVDVVRDLETKHEVIICSYEDGEHTGYFTLTKEEFCAKVDYDGKKIKKYFRNTLRKKISDTDIKYLHEDGYRAPVRHDKNEDVIRKRRNAATYIAYAKDLCVNYHYDIEIYQLCVQQKLFIGVRNKSDYLILKEDLLFLHNCLKTTLKKYATYFQERFIEKKSVRKYGDDHGLNRGSVDYIQKKFIIALAKNLEDRDKSDNTIRLNQFEE